MRQDIIATRRYDSSIAGDELSLKIASYPATARYLAKRLRGKGDTVCELCCGIGISLMELSRYFKKVIGVDNDPLVIESCDKNLKNSGRTNYVLECEDVSSRSVLSKIEADVVLYDIPYWSTHAGQVDPEKLNPNLKKLVTDIRELISENIVIYAPVSIDYREIVDQVGVCEFVEVYVNGRYDRNFIFLGGLAQKIGESKVTLMQA